MDSRPFHLISQAIDKCWITLYNLLNRGGPLKARYQLFSKRCLSLALSLAMLGQPMAWSLPARDALAPASIFQADDASVPADETSRDQVILSEIRDVYARLLPHAPVLILGDASLNRHIPREWFLSDWAGAIHVAGPDLGVIAETLRKNGLSVYPLQEHLKLHEADMAFVPNALREAVRQIVRDAGAKDFKDTVKRLNKAYLDYQGRSLPKTMEGINAGLVIATTGVEDLYAFFYDEIVRPLSGKFRMSSSKVEARLAGEGHAAAWENLAGRLMEEHVRMLYRVCHPYGLVYFCAPFAHLDGKKLRDLTQPPGAVGPGQVIGAYRQVAQAWQRGILLGHSAPPPFAAQLWEGRAQDPPPLQWLSPAGIVFNAQGSPIAHSFYTLGTNVFGHLPHRGSRSMLLFQSLLLTPDLRLHGRRGEDLSAEESPLPPAKQPSLQETFAYLLPRLRSLPTVQERLDLITKTLQREHPQAAEPLMALFQRLKSRRDMDVIRELAGKLKEGQILDEDASRDLAGVLLLDRSGAGGQEQQEALDIVLAAQREAAGERAGHAERSEQAASMEELLRNETVQALSEIFMQAAAGMKARSDVFLQDLIREQIKRDVRTRQIDADSPFVLDHCLYVKVPVLDREIALRFYREAEKPFNVLRDLSAAELTALLRHPVGGDLRVQAERHSQVRDALTWDYQETRAIAHFARALEQGQNQNAVEALKTLHQRLLRQEFYALMNRLDTTALRGQVRASKDAEALSLLRAYQDLAAKMQRLESAVGEDWKSPDRVAKALLDIHEGEDGHYLDAVVWMAQWLQERALGRLFSAGIVHAALEEILRDMPQDYSVVFAAMEKDEADAILDEYPQGKAPENLAASKKLLRALRVRIAAVEEEKTAWKNRTWWQTLFETVDEIRSEGAALDRRLEHLKNRRDDLLAAFAGGIVQRIPSGNAGALVYLLQLEEAKMDYVLDRMVSVPPEDITAFLALTALPLKNARDAKRMDRMFGALQGLKSRGVDFFKNAPFRDRIDALNDLYARVQERLTGLPWYDNGGLQGRLEDASREETSVFWDREIAFQIMVEAIKAKYGEDLMLMVEPGDTARREDAVLDRNPERCSGHHLQLVFRPYVLLKEAQSFVSDLTQSLGALGVSVQTFHAQGFRTTGLGDLPDESDPAALLTGASGVDQCIAAMENKILYQNGDKEAQELMEKRLLSVIASANSPREAVGYAMLQHLLMEQSGAAVMPQRLAHYVLRMALAKMIFLTHGAVLEEMRPMLQGNKPRVFSHAVHALARKYLAANAAELELIGKALRNEAKLFALPSTPSMEQFVDDAVGYMYRTSAELAQSGVWENQDDKDFLRAMVSLLPLFQRQGAKWYGKGQKILLQGQHAKSVYLLLSGSVQVVCRDGTGKRVRGIYKAGSMIGEKFVFPRVASDAEIAAATDALLVPANKTEFWYLLDQNPLLKNQVLELLFESEMSHLILARNAASDGSDPSGILLGALLNRAGEMIAVFRRWGISEEKLARYQKGVRDGADVQEEVAVHPLDTSAAVAQKARPSFLDTVTDLLPELRAMTGVPERIGRIMDAFRDVYDMGDKDKTMEALADLLRAHNEGDSQTMIKRLVRVKVLPAEAAELLRQEPAPAAPAAEEPAAVMPEDPAGWDERLRLSLAQQDAALLPGQAIYLLDKEGRLRPLKEVSVEAMPRPNPARLFLDIAPDASTVDYYEIPAGMPAQDFLRQVDGKEIRPAGETGLPGAFVLGKKARHVLMRYAPAMRDGVLWTWDKDWDIGFRGINMDAVLVHKALAESGALQGDHRAAVVLGTDSGETAAALAQIPGLKDLYFSSISPYALCATRLHLANNRRGAGPREHALLGPGLLTLQGPSETGGKFDLLVAYPYSIVASDPATVDKTLYRGTGMLREFLEYAAEKLNPENPEALGILVGDGLGEAAIAKYVAEFGVKYFLEPLGPDGRLYRLRLKASQSEAHEKRDARAIVRERLRNLDIARGRTLTDEELDRAFTQAFGRHYSEAGAYLDFIQDFSGAGGINYQIWHSYLPAELSLSENILLLAGIMHRIKAGRQAGQQKAVSIDLRALIDQVKDEQYLKALRAQWERTKPEEGMELSRSSDDPYSYAVSSVLIPEPVAPPAERAVPAEEPIMPEAPVAAPRPAFARLPAVDSGEQFFKHLLSLPEEAFEGAAGARLSKSGVKLHALSEAWLEERAKAFPEYRHVLDFLREMVGQYKAAGLELKIAVGEDKEVFSVPMSDMAVDRAMRTILQRNPDKVLQTVVIPGGVFQLAAKGTFESELRPVLQHHRDRKIIADSLQRNVSVETLEKLPGKGVRVNQDQRNAWIEQFALYAAALNERRGGEVLPRRIVDILQHTFSEDLQAIVQDTDKSVASIRENKLFGLVDSGDLIWDTQARKVLPARLPGGFKAMIVNHRRLVAEHAMSILAQRGMPFRPLPEPGIAEKDIIAYGERVGELETICENAHRGMVQAMQDRGIPFVFLAPLIATARNHYQTLGARQQDVQNRVLDVVQAALGVYHLDADLRQGVLQVLELCGERDRGSRAPGFAELLGKIKAYRDATGYDWMRPGDAPFPKNPLPGTIAVDIAPGPDFVASLESLAAEDQIDVVDPSRFATAYIKEYLALSGDNRVNVRENDVRALAKPQMPLGLVRARNTWAYVKGFTDKVKEMCDWLEPGGRIVLEADAHEESLKTMQAYTHAFVEALVAEGWKAERVSGQFGQRVVLTKPAASFGPAGSTRRRFLAVLGTALLGERMAKLLHAAGPVASKTLEQHRLDEAKRIVVTTFEAYHQELLAHPPADGLKARAVFDARAARLTEQMLVLLKDEPEFKNMDRSMPNLDIGLLNDRLPAYFLRNGLYFAVEMKMAPLSGKLIELPAVCLYEIDGDIKDIQMDLGVFTAKAKEVMLSKALLPWFVSKESQDVRVLSGTNGYLIYHDLEKVKDDARHLWAYRAAYKNDLELFENTPLMDFLKGKGMGGAMRLLKNAFVYMAYEQELSGNNEEAFVRRYVERNLAMQRVHELTHVYDMKEFKPLLQGHPESVREIMEERAFLMPIVMGENAYHALQKIFDMADQKSGIPAKAASVILSSLHEFITNPPPEFRDPRFLATEDGSFFRQLQQPPPGISPADAQWFLMIQTARMTPALWSAFAGLMFNATQDTLGQWEKGAPVPPLVPVGQTVRGVETNHLQLFESIRAELGGRRSGINKSTPWIAPVDGNRSGMIKELSRGDKGGGIHLGAAGFLNLDIIAVRQSQLGIFFDANPNMGIVLELIQKAILPAKDRTEFMNLLCEGLEGKTKELFGTRLNFEHNEELVRYELNNKFGWLASEKKFRYIKRMFREGKIIFVNLDLLDENSFGKLAELIKVYGYEVDTIYASNIQNWIERNRGDVGGMFRSVSALITSPKTLYVDSYSEYDLSSDAPWMDLRVRKALEVKELHQYRKISAVLDRAAGDDILEEASL